MPVTDRPRYQAAQGRRARMIAAATAAKRRLRGLTGGRAPARHGGPPETKS